jgi:D-alanine-D-alanine ligase
MGLAAKVFRAAFCEGMARVDFFLTAEEDLTVIEINTIPGFTDHSMFPRIWAASGLPFPQLVGELVDLALKRWQKRRALTTSFEEGRLLDGKRGHTE